MIVTYSPAGQPQKSWQFVPEDLSESVAEVIERRWGGDTPTYEAWQQAIMHGQSRARRVLLWYLQWTDHPSLRLEDVDPKRSELKVEFTVSEVQRMLARVQASKRMDQDDKAKLIEALEIQLESAPPDELPVGKAPSES
jgi:hypothetical protein